MPGLVALNDAHQAVARRLGRPAPGAFVVAQEGEQFQMLPEGRRGNGRHQRLQGVAGGLFLAVSVADGALVSGRAGAGHLDQQLSLSGGGPIGGRALAQEAFKLVAGAPAGATGGTVHRGYPTMRTPVAMGASVSATAASGGGMRVPVANTAVGESGRGGRPVLISRDAGGGGSGDAGIRGRGEIGGNGPPPRT